LKEKIQESSSFCSRIDTETSEFVGDLNGKPSNQESFCEIRLGGFPTMNFLNKRESTFRNDGLDGDEKFDLDKGG